MECFIYDYFLHYEETYWQRNRLYDFSVNLIGNHFHVSIDQGDISIFDTIIGNSPFYSGHVGLRTVDQEVLYSNIAYHQAVPEPLTILGAGTAIGFGTTFKRKLAQTKKKDKQA